MINQRLVRQICTRCKQLTNNNIWPDQLAGRRPPGGPPLAVGAGCETCHQTGYRGRTGVFEILSIDEPITNLIMQRANAQAITTQAGHSGSTALLDDAMAKILNHLTTPTEVLRVIE